MYKLANIFLQSYIPTELEVGMYFKKEHWFIKYGNETPLYEIWELKELPEGDIDEFFAKNGYPVTPVIGEVQENPDAPISILATFEEVGWIEYEDMLHEIELKDINYLLMQFQGSVGIFLDEDDSFYLEEGKMVICPIDELYQDEDYDEEYV